MRLLLVGEFNVRYGSGYTEILRQLASGLDARGHIVTVVGENWARGEHAFPFQVIPSHHTWVPGQVARILESRTFDHVLLAMDLPRVVGLSKTESVKKYWKVPTSLLFAVESHPVLEEWAGATRWAHARFVISKFGKRNLGADCYFVPVTAEAVGPFRQTDLPEPVWPVDYDIDGDLTMLTVADNQERKDLPVIAQALKMLPSEWKWLLVTRAGASYGWHMPEMLEQFGVEDRTMVFENLPSDQLKAVYQAADVFVLASQAEGACLPLYEAMGHGIHCVAPDHTAIREALEDGRGTLVKPAWASCHPWGNVTRYHTSPVDLMEAVQAAPMERSSELVEFIRDRSWDNAVSVVEGVWNGDG